MKKNILLCDANFCVLPIVETIKKMDYNLSVVGSLLSDPAHQIADNSVDINYSDLDLLNKHIVKNKYDFIIPGCNDRAYLSLAHLAQNYNFVGFDTLETVLIIHEKDKFKKFAKENGYPIPKAVTNLESISELNFPIIIKPVDSFSGKGTNKVENYQESEHFWKEALKFSQNGSVIAEEFIEGKLYSHSAFIKNGKIIIDFFVNEYCTIYPYQVNSSNVATKLNDDIKKKVRIWLEQFASDLDLVDGLVHTQFISNNKEFFLIEVARRCPGDLYSQLIEKSTGINYSQLYVMPFIGIELPDKIEIVNQKFFSRHTVSSLDECIFIASNCSLSAKTIENIQLKKSGDFMRSAPFDKSGIYFIEHYNKESMEETTEKLKDYISIEKLKI